MTNKIKNGFAFFNLDGNWICDIVNDGPKGYVSDTFLIGKINFSENVKII